MQNTNKMLADALVGGYAVPAFNFYNLETLRAIMAAAEQTHSPVILSVSESALKYMGDDFITGIILTLKSQISNLALHLDHGSSVDACRHAIDLGFTSVMIDASKLPFDENIAATRAVVEYAAPRNVSVEAELGVLSGIEDDVSSDKNIFTNPDDVVRFVSATGCNSLAIAIGTSHGAYKRKSEAYELRFDILDAVARQLPDFPLVLHGASSVPQNLVDMINEFGGKLENARGIPVAQIRRAVEMNVCKINVDSDARLAFTAAVRRALATAPENFDPRKFLMPAIDLMTQTYIWEIENIMGSNNKSPSPSEGVDCE